MKLKDKNRKFLKKTSRDILDHLESIQKNIISPKKNISEIVDKASDVIPLVWPIKSYIASNPLRDLESIPFEQAIKTGEAAFSHTYEDNELEEQVNRELIKWSQVFLDEELSVIKMPFREKGFFKSWSLLVKFDKKIHKGIPARKKWLSSLSSLTAEESLHNCLEMLSIPDDQIESFLRMSLCSLPGLAGYIKRQSKWSQEIQKYSISLIDFLAVRLAIRCCLSQEKPNFRGKINPSKINNLNFGFISLRIRKDFLEMLGIFSKGNGQSAISEEKSTRRTRRTTDNQRDKPKVQVNIKKLKETEEKYIQFLTPKIKSQLILKDGQSHLYDAQLVFCIDIRSEPIRKEIERQGNYETYGFAGFFGIPLRIHNFTTDSYANSCPVLIEPQHVAFEIPLKHDVPLFKKHKQRRSLILFLNELYQNLKYNFASPFALAETLGPWCGMWTFCNLMIPKKALKIKKIINRFFSPVISTNLSPDNIPLKEQANYAKTALRMMGLIDNFSKIIVFCGHGSTTLNNPYEPALQCGACGSHRGGPNAKVLSSILNNFEIRKLLIKENIVIPEDTIFLAAEHDTTSDEIMLYDENVKQHLTLLSRLKSDLKNASFQNRNFRQNSLPKSQFTLSFKRSYDWSEVRPEWGLAKNAAFFIGPRWLTKNLHLEGRSFLHSYNWEIDKDGLLLEAILTGPLIVAEWINTHYLFSTLNNVRYGGGSKITQNVSGKIGIIQGNGSDYMYGLPLQSVYLNDKSPYHEPMRLLTIIYSTCKMMDNLMLRNEKIKSLLFNKWINLIVVDPENRKMYRFDKTNTWVKM